MGTLAYIAPNCSMILILLPLLLFCPFLLAPFFLPLISPSFPFSFPLAFPILWPASLSKLFSRKHQIASKFQPVYKMKRIYSSWNNFLEVKGSITSGMAWLGYCVSLKFSLGPFLLALPLISATLMVPKIPDFLLYGTATQSRWWECFCLYIPEDPFDLFWLDRPSPHATSELMT